MNRCIEPGCTAKPRTYKATCPSHAERPMPKPGGLYWPTEAAYAMDTSAQADQGKEAVR